MAKASCRSCHVFCLRNEKKPHIDLMAKFRETRFMPGSISYAVLRNVHKKFIIILATKNYMRIVRTCSCIDSVLSFVKPLGYSPSLPSWPPDGSENKHVSIMIHAIHRPETSLNFRSLPLAISVLLSMVSRT